MKEKIKGKKIIILCSIIIAVVIAVWVLFILISKNDKEDKEISLSDNSISTEEYYVEPINAEEYLNEIAKVQKKYDASSSKNILTEEKLMKMLSERGFSEFPVETNYSMNGEYYDAKKLSSDSSEKHPIYETYFISDDGSSWSIEIVNGLIYASPISYNMREDLEVPVMLSEAEYITSYDSVTNQFFEIIPNESEMKVKIIPKITAEKLASLTIEEIDKL